MSENFEKLVAQLFNNEKVTNFKLFPGSQREVDFDDVVNELNSALNQIQSSQVEEISF